MSEKMMVTIESGLVIPEGSEKVFENQHIRLEAGIECRGTLIFKNCTIEPCAKLESKMGKNHMQTGMYQYGNRREIRNGWVNVISMPHFGRSHNRQRILMPCMTHRFMRVQL